MNEAKNDQVRHLVQKDVYIGGLFCIPPHPSGAVRSEAAFHRRLLHRGPSETTGQGGRDTPQIFADTLTLF